MTRRSCGATCALTTRNGAYVDDDDAAPLIPSLHARNVRLFEAYFRRFDAARVR